VCGPRAEGLLPHDNDNPTEGAASAKAGSIWFKLPLLLWLPVQTVTIIAGAWQGLTTLNPKP